jgi:hypothetical protein
MSPMPAMAHIGRWALLGVMLACSCVAAAQERNLEVKAGPSAERRVALVIGNAAYRSTQPLRNPVNDARAIADRLKKLGFEVILRTDSGQKEMNRAITEFGQRLSGGGVGLFYFAGHGMQVRGKNFLLPVDADIEGEAAVRSESVDLDLALDQMGSARVGMVILDACRNNPFERRFRSGAGGGLAQVDAPKGVLIAYATAPGKVAADGSGKNGLYTAELLRALDEPARRVEDVFKQVRSRVSAVTGDQQIPWESSSLTGDFYFAVPASGPIAGQGGTGASQREPGSSQGTDAMAVELEMWRSVKDSVQAADFTEYLKHYPEGKFAGLARARLAKLEQGGKAGTATIDPAALVGGWQFGRLSGALLAPAGQLCDVELTAEKGGHGHVLSACDSNESFWRVAGENLEFIGSNGFVTTRFTRRTDVLWEGPFLGSSPGFNFAPGVVHYLKREESARHDGTWVGELETYGGLFDSPVKVAVELKVKGGQLAGTVHMYGETRKFSGRVDRQGNLVEGRLVGALQGYQLHGKIWDGGGDGALGWKLRFKLGRKPLP